MFSHTRFVVIAALCAPIVLSAQQTTQLPKVVNAQVTSQAAGSNLRSTLMTLAQGSAPVWAGYVVPVETAFHSGWGQNGVTYLEPGKSSSEQGYRGSTSPEQDHIAILFRLSGGKVEQLRTVAPVDTLDAGGLHLVWLEGVSAEQSIAALEAIALEPAADKSKPADTAVFLISLHRSAATVPALVAIAAPANSLHVREKAAFWLANQRGHEGFVADQNFAEHDADAAFREKLTFDLTLSKDPGVVPELIRMAHEDQAPRVRQQAQFWMAQRGGKLVAGELTSDAERDPDAGVRKQAVFAISRLPHEQASEKLIELASTSKYPEVRKQAVFWLGQSSDPKALAYLSTLLTSAKP